MAHHESTLEGDDRVPPVADGDDLHLHWQTSLAYCGLEQQAGLGVLGKAWMKKQGKSEAEIQLQSSRMAAPLLLELLILLEPFKRIGFSRLRVHRVA